MTEEASSTSGKPKESAVLKDGSLSILAKEIGQDELHGLVLAMYLNLPNTNIVRVANEASENGLQNANENVRIEATRKLLLMWKSLRSTCKEKEKIKELERALKELGKPEMAEVIVERHGNNQELTSDAFAA